MRHPSGTATTFAYDGGTSPYAAASGELTRMLDESGSTTYVYDSLGRLGTKTVAIGSKTFVVNYGWGNAGAAMDKLTSITYPRGSRVNYSYDSGGDVVAISVHAVNSNGVGFSGSATALLGSVTYTVERQPAGWQWSDGKTRGIGYDSYGQVISYDLGDPAGTSTKAGSTRTLTRDAAGRITAFAHSNGGSPVSSLAQSFGYDNLDRLTRGE